VRLCPSYYLALLLAVVLSPILDDPCPQNVAIQAVFAQTVSPSFCQCTFWGIVWVPNPAAWFVSDIMLLSFAFPFLYNIFPDGPRIILPLLAIIMVARSGPQFANVQHSVEWYTSPALRLFEYAAGMLSAKLCHQIQSEQFQWKFWGLLFDGSIVAAIAVVSQCPGDKLRSDYYITGLICVSCVASYAVAVQVYEERGSLWILGRCLSCRALQFLGKHSYSIYILQLPIMALAGDFYQHPSQKFSWVHLLVFVVCQVLGVVASVVVQNPLTRILDVGTRKPK